MAEQTKTERSLGALDRQILDDVSKEDAKKEIIGCEEKITELKKRMTLYKTGNTFFLYAALGGVALMHYFGANFELDLLPLGLFGSASYFCYEKEEELEEEIERKQELFDILLDKLRPER